MSHQKFTSWSDRPPAVIVGFELNGLGVARALAPHGIECIGLAHPSPHPARKTNTCKVIPTHWSPEGLVGQLVEIGKTQRRKMPLLITKETPVRWISAARDELAEFYEFLMPDESVVDLLLDKSRFALMSQREGWPIPRTWRIQSKETLLDVLDGVPFPCILKPEVHTDFFGDRSPRKAFKVFDAAELLRTYDMAAQWTDAFVLQEWVKGGDDRVAFCLTYVGQNEQAHTFFAGRKVRQFPPECGNTALCEPAPQAWSEPICALTKRIWRAVGFRGVGSIEYKVRLSTDDLVIVEPTVGRTNYQNEIAVLNGVNIPLIAYCDLARLPLPTVTAPSRQYKLIDGVREFRSACFYFRNGSLTRQQWFRDRRGRRRYMTLRANDPAPFVASVVSELRPLAGAVLERIVGRKAKNRIKHIIGLERAS